MIPHGIWWSLWRECNARTFVDKESSIVALKSRCISVLYFWAVHSFFLFLGIYMRT